MPLENVILTTENCRYCLMCRHIAPVEQITHKETHSPHGWGLLIASVRRGLLSWDADTVEALYTAPDGGNSRAHCVTDQPLPAAIAAARAEVVEEGLAPAAAYEVNRALEAWGNPYRESAPEPADGEGDVALFVGDEARYLWPEALEAARRVLATLDLDPVMIGIGRNNGYLASSLGFPRTARALARATLDELEATGARRLLVLSPGDYFTFSQLYDERLGIVWPQEVEIEEVTLLLAEGLGSGALGFRRESAPTAYAYVDPTHAVRVPFRHDAPRQLLRATMATDGRELYWRRERAHPVGSTALKFTRPEIAEKLTRARLGDARDVGAEVVITEDPGTLHELRRHADEYELRVRGLYELLADRL